MAPLRPFFTPLAAVIERYNRLSYRLKRQWTGSPLVHNFRCKLSTHGGLVYHAQYPHFWSAE
jgi:hypothetical protein